MSASSLEKIDLHTHIMPEGLPDFAERFGDNRYVTLEHHKPGVARMHRLGKIFREVEPNCWDVDTRLQECDAHNVAVQVMSTIPVLFNYWAPAEQGYETSRYLNDHIAGCVQEAPGRFVGLGTLPMQAPELAVKELHRCVGELGMPGVQIGSHVERHGGRDWDLHAPEVVEVLAECERLGAAVCVHPWDMMGQAQTPDYWMPWLVGMPAETARAIVAMISGGVFEKLPGLRVCFAHGGGAFPFTVGRIQHGFDCRPDLCAVDNATPPREYIGRFYVDAHVHDKDALRYLINQMGADKICLGSDYPFPLGEAVAGSMIDEMGDLSDETKAQLFNGSARAFLDLPVPAQA